MPDGMLVPFEGEPGVATAVPVEVSYTLPPAPGTDVIFETCETDASSVGGLVIDALSRDAGGDIDGLVGTPARPLRRLRRDPR
jgi:hypothetical protein